MTNIEFVKEHIEQLKDALKTCKENNITELSKSIELELIYWQPILKDLEELQVIKNEFDENKKSDITGLSLNRIKEIHKNDTPVEALDILHRLSLAPDYVKPHSVEEMARRFLRDKVEQALNELKAIKEAKSSEALDKLEGLGFGLLNEDKSIISINGHYFKNAYDTIKATLLKTQEQEKVLNNIHNIISKYMFELATVSNKEELKTNTINAIIKEVE